MIGQRIEREYEGRLWEGTVDSYDEDHQLYHIKYDEDDFEDFSEEELLTFLIDIESKNVRF